MSGFVNPFVSGRHLRLVGLGIWLGVAGILVAGGCWLGVHQLRESLRREAGADFARLNKLHDDLVFAFGELDRTVVAPPCSAAFRQQLRQVAFLPDGLNEFMYAPEGIVMCSTSRDASQAPVPLGSPNIAKSPGDGFDAWINAPLDLIGHPGETGTILLKNPFAIVVPTQAFGVETSDWLKKEIAVSTPSQRVWHVSGEKGLVQRAIIERGNGGFGSPIEAVCGAGHPICVAAQADLSDFAFKWRYEAAIAVAMLTFYAAWPASAVYRALDHYWSFEQRFRRNLNSSSVICAYQPILDLRTGRISGCEVLVRWRDVDGSIVPPDKFVDIVEHSQNTLTFTKMVAERAYAELSQNLPQNARLQINFNIFPRDLVSETLSDAFACFGVERDRFQLALEIVESDAVAVDSAQSEIEALAQLGIRTYIDDFGSGYSSIHRVASLSIHGVKLDRSFAMAPNESLMARMLVHALDMIGSSGREIVVEGVETQERLDLLVATQRVAYAQGYLISRPLSIEGLVQFLAAHDPAEFLARKERLAA